MKVTIYDGMWQGCTWYVDVNQLIDVKYGGIDHAEGTPELEEFRQMIGAYEDERKKKRKNDTKRTRNKIKGI